MGAERLPSICEIRDALARDDWRYSRNYPPGAKTWPIPYFGDLISADVLTIGVNPSHGEFASDRWQDVHDAAACERRLKTYFANEFVKPHPWFRVWERSLNHIGVSYVPARREYLAAHLDLSPRPTLPMGSVPDKGVFLAMVIRDLQFFVRFIKAGRCARLIMLSGCVTSLYYMNEFLALYLPQHGFELEGDFDRAANAGKGKVATFRLKGPSFELPVFFCSSSPSDRRNPELLTTRVWSNRKSLKEFLTWEK